MLFWTIVWISPALNYIDIDVQDGWEDEMMAGLPA